MLSYGRAWNLNVINILWHGQSSADVTTVDIHLNLLNGQKNRDADAMLVTVTPGAFSFKK